VVGESVQLRHVDAMAASEGHGLVTTSAQFSHHMMPDNSGCSGHCNTHVLILPHEFCTAWASR
jgi:hypothetical protein